MASDEGLVDTFLHRREHVFSSGDCLDLVHEAGLIFQGWKENGLYYPDTRLAANNPLWPHLRKLPPRSLWQTVEMLDASISAHWFHACRSDRDPASYVIQFDDDAFLDYVPLARISQMSPPDPAQVSPRSSCARRCRPWPSSSATPKFFGTPTASAPSAPAWRQPAFPTRPRPLRWPAISSALYGASAMCYFT